MIRSDTSYLVLDAYAIMAYLYEESGGQQVRQALRQGRKESITVFFSLINYGECLYSVEKKHGLDAVPDAVKIVDLLPIQIVAPDVSQVMEAAHLKAKYPISYADAFAAALAMRYDAPVMTGDPEFLSLEKLIAIRWLGGK